MYEPHCYLFTQTSESIVESRRLRLEQDIAYQQSLEVDRAKVAIYFFLKKRYSFFPSILQDADKQNKLLWLQVCSIQCF